MLEEEKDNLPKADGNENEVNTAAGNGQDQVMENQPKADPMPSDAAQGADAATQDDDAENVAMPTGPLSADAELKTAPESENTDKAGDPETEAHPEEPLIAQSETQPDVAEPIDAEMAVEASENDSVPEDLITEGLENAPAGAGQINVAETGTESENPDKVGDPEAETQPEAPLVAGEETQPDIAEPIDAEMAVEASENDSVPDDLITEGLEDVPADAGQINVAASSDVIETDAEIDAHRDNVGDPGETISEITTDNDDLQNEIIEEEDHLKSVTSANAAESEEDTAHGHDIPMDEYDKLSMDEMVAELERLVAVEKLMSVKDHVEELRRAFNSHYHHFIDEKRDEWKAENPETTEDFHYHLPAKARFDQLYGQYRDRKNKHFQQLQSNLKANLDVRLGIVEELKNLINPQDDIKDTLKTFNELRERWKHAGPIPKDKYNHVWNNYHFHVENFYDYLHLDREARDGDFRNNLEQKQKIIARAEELAAMPDVGKAFRELQNLHRVWKEEIGPVSREHREEIWKRFSDLTKIIHDKREEIFEKQRGNENENLQRKQEIIAGIEALSNEKAESHNNWQQLMEKVESLRNDFFGAGRVPSEVNEQTWSAFKSAVRNFNSAKNAFYKEIKKDQNDNLSRKQALVAKANELKDSEDFAATTAVMKQIQDEWKTIGHVPRKYSDKLWAEFKSACNHYFERMKSSRKEENAEENQAYENKKNYLDTMRQFELSGQHKTDLDAIKAHIETWKSFGRVPQNRRHVEGKFNKILDALFEKLSLSKKESDMMRFSNRMETLSGSGDTRKLDNEKIFLMRKIDETQSEIFQLENNIQFFSSGKDSKKENPMVAEVRRNIDKHKEELGVLREKLKQLRAIERSEGN